MKWLLRTSLAVLVSLSLSAGGCASSITEDDAGRVAEDFVTAVCANDKAGVSAALACDVGDAEVLAWAEELLGIATGCVVDEVQVVDVVAGGGRFVCLVEVVSPDLEGGVVLLQVVVERVDGEPCVTSAARVELSSEE